MIKLEHPDLDAGDVFKQCISRVRNKELKTRLESIEADVSQASETFADLAAQVRLYEFVREAVVNGVVTTAEMEAVYNQRMVPKTAPGRAAYDKLMSLARSGNAHYALSEMHLHSTITCQRLTIQYYLLYR